MSISPSQNRNLCITIVSGAAEPRDVSIQVGLCRCNISLSGEPCRQTGSKLLLSHPEYLSLGRLYDLTKLLSGPGNLRPTGMNILKHDPLCFCFPL